MADLPQQSRRCGKRRQVIQDGMGRLIKCAIQGSGMKCAAAVPTPKFIDQLVVCQAKQVHCNAILTVDIAGDQAI
jgi:hypothetical protein